MLPYRVDRRQGLGHHLQPGPGPAGRFRQVLLPEAAAGLTREQHQQVAGDFVEP